MAHASEEYRYSTRDYRTQKTLLHVLEHFNQSVLPLEQQYNGKRVIVEREIAKIKRLLDKRGLGC